MYQKENQTAQPGVWMQDGRIVNINESGRKQGFWDNMPTIKSLLENQKGLLLVEEILKEKGDCVVDDPKKCSLLAPLPDAGKILGVALNYRDFCERGNLPLPKTLKIFGKYKTAINQPDGEFDIQGRKVTYEGELGVVIGKKCRNAEPSDAETYIAGYTIINDLTANDWVKEDVQLFRGKNMDGSFPMGPMLVTKEEIGDPMNLLIRTEVDGEIRQNSSTKNMVFNIYEQIAFFSSFMTLLPGDVIASGTPAGTALQYDPPRFLKAGQKVAVSIEGIGTLVTNISSKEK